MCWLCLLSLSFSFFVNAATTKTVNIDEWFESLESILSIINIFLNLWIWMRRGVWIKHSSNAMSLMSMLHSNSLQSVLINQCWTEYKWIRVVEFQYYWITHTQNYIRLAKKRFIADFWYEFDRFQALSKIAYLITISEVLRP